MKVFKSWVMERISKIQDKYQFEDTFEIEQEGVYEFCTDFERAVGDGLNADKDDIDFINQLIEKINE